MRLEGPDQEVELAAIFPAQIAQQCFAAVRIATERPAVLVNQFAQALPGDVTEGSAVGHTVGS
jgi:hypothetical protein